jgi:hypothetical protein
MPKRQMAMLRGLRRRLDRLWEAHRREVAYYDSLSAGARARENFVAAVRAGLAHAGIDPDSVAAIRRYKPEPPMLREPYRPPGPLETLREELLRMRRHDQERPLDLNQASLMELFATYCFIPDGPGITYLGRGPLEPL